MTNIPRFANPQMRVLSLSSLRDFYAILFRHLGKGLLFFFLFLAITIPVILSLDDVFESRAKLLIRVSQQRLTLNPVTMTDGGEADAPDWQSEVQSELEILNSEEILNSLITAVGPQNILGSPPKIRMVTKALVKTIVDMMSGESTAQEAERPAPPVSPSVIWARAMKTLTKDLALSVVPNTNVVNIGYRSQQPEVAQMVVSTLIDLYVEKHIKTHQMEQSYPFLEEQTALLEQRIKEVESQLESLSDEAGVIALDEQLKLAVNQMNGLETDIEETDRGIAVSNAKIGHLEQLLENLPERVLLQESRASFNNAVDNMNAQLFELRLKESEFLSRFSRGSPKMDAYYDQLNRAEKLLETETKRDRVQTTWGINVERQNVENSLRAEKVVLAGLNARLDTLHLQLMQTTEQFRKWNSKKLDFARLERELEIQELNLRRYVANLQAARIDRALVNEKISNISVIQPATLPALPVGSNQKWYILICLLVAASGAIGLIFVAEFLDDRIWRVEDIESKLQVPVLGTIRKRRGVNMRRLAKVKAPGNLQNLLPATTTREYLALGEQVLLAMGDGREAKAIGVIGSQARVGATTVASYLATSLDVSGSSERILLVTVNQPAVARLFRKKKSPMVAAAADGTRGEPLELIPGFYIQCVESSTASLLLRRNLLRERLQEWKQHYHYIVIDFPTMPASNFFSASVSLCDGVVLVIDRDCRWQTASAIAKLLKTKDSRILGAVFNKRKDYIPGWLYRTL